jgi:RimJ/RimL family protein N-acetyltransferase
MESGGEARLRRRSQSLPQLARWRRQRAPCTRNRQGAPRQAARLAVAKGFSTIETGTTKDNRAMLRLNLSAGFEVIGTYTRDSGPRVILQKRLGE